MKSHKPAHFPQGKVLEVQRSLGLGGPAYICPHCGAAFTQFPKLWAHAKDTHRGSLEAIGSSKEAEEQEKDRFKQKASDIAHGKSTTLKPPTSARAGDNTSVATLPRSASPKRPSTAPGQSSVNQGSDLLGTDNGAALIGNPRKRGAGSGSSPEAPSGGDRAPPANSRARHTRNVSNSQAIDKDFQRQRNPWLGAAKLFDHKTEDASSRTLPRKAKPPSSSHRGHHAHGSKGHATQASRQGEHESVQEARLPSRASLGAAGPIQLLQQPKPNSVQIPNHSVKLEPASHDSESHLVTVDDPVGPDDPEPDTTMLRQPETRPISHDQLVVEVKGIYAGLVMVEAKCIEVDERQTILAQDKDSLKKQPLTNDQWRSLIALHKQLLHEHHDFFLASQHPSASSNLSKLAAKYSMPARMWRHGIHAFLEVLRHRLPESLDHMLAFIYIAYSMMALLYETVATFEDTWIECLGDLGRYRMAIEDDEPRDRETWSNVAKYWYSKASDKSPHVGRLYHHLAILARPYTLEQLSLYTRSLTCVTPFESARGSIMTLLNPVLAGRISHYHRTSEMETLVIKAHGILFVHPQRPLEDFSQILGLLKGGVVDGFFKDRSNDQKWKRTGAFLAVSNIAAIFENGALAGNAKHRSPLRRDFEAWNVRKEEEEEQNAMVEANVLTDDVSMRDASEVKPTLGSSVEPDGTKNPLTPAETEMSSIIVDHASELAFSIFAYAIAEEHWHNKLSNHLLPLIHIMMIFVWSCALAENPLKRVERFIPWEAMCMYLNQLAIQPNMKAAKIYQKDFPKPNVGVGRPLWEDFILRGLLYTMWYYPKPWFSDAGIDDEERQLEASSMDVARAERVLWLGHRIASLEKWIRFDQDTKKFQLIETEMIDASETSSFPALAQPETPSNDSIMIDAPTPSVKSPNSSIAPSDAPEVQSVYSPTTTITQDSEIGETTSEPTTPKAEAIEEHDDDVPMIDISPGQDPSTTKTGGVSPVFDPSSSPPKTTSPKLLP